jgi:hypothetical protein
MEDFHTSYEGKVIGFNGGILYTLRGQGGYAFI